jgi:hypothetical protein
MTSQRIVIATAAAKGLELFQIDVKNAYLNGEIDTDIYMKQPVGFEDPRYPDMVWALQKDLYSLKQAGNIWNAAIHGYILELGFKDKKKMAHSHSTQKLKNVCLVSNNYFFYTLSQAYKLAYTFV